MEPHRLLASLSKPSDRLFLLRVEDDILRFLSSPWGSAPPNTPFIPRHSLPVSPNACGAPAASSSRSSAPTAPELSAAARSSEQAGRAGSARQGGEGALARRRVRPGAEPWTRGRSARANGEAGEGSGRLVVTVESDTATGAAEKKIRAEIEARVGARPGEGEARKVDGEAGGAAAQEGAREAERKVLRGRGHGVDGEAELQKGQDEGRLAERTGGAEGSGGDVGAREMRGEAERGESDLEEGLESGEEGAGSEGEKQGFQRRVCKGRGFKAHQGGGAWAAAAAADARIAAGQQGTAGVANDSKAGRRRKSWEGSARGENSAAEENSAERAVDGVTTGVELAGGIKTGGVTTGGITVTDGTEMGREGTARRASDAMLVFPKLRSYHRLLVHSAAKRFRLSSSSYPLWGNTGYKHVCCSLTTEQLVSRPASGVQARSCTLWYSFVPPLMLCDFIPGGGSREQTLERAAQASPVPKRFSLPVTVAGVGRREVQGGREWKRRGGGMDESTKERRGGGGGKCGERAESEGDEVSLVPKRKGRGRFLYHEKEGSSGVEKLKERSGKGRGEERSEGTRGGDDWGAGRRGDGGERGFGEHWRGEKGKGEEGQWEKGCWDGERGGGGGGNRWHTKGREGSEKGGSERRGEGKGCGSEESSAGLTAAEMVTLSEEDFGADEGLDGVIITRASHDYRMWQVEEDKSRAVDEGDRVRVPWGATEGSHGLPAGAKEDCGSGEELAAAGTRHILVVRAELCELEKAIEKITEMVLHHSPEPPPYESLPAVLVRRAVQVITGLHPSVRAVPVAAAEQIQGAGKEAEGDEREEAAEAVGMQGTDRGVAAAGTFLVIFASAEIAGTAEWRIREARRRARRGAERRRAGSEHDSSSSSRGSRDRCTGERLEGCADGCLEKDADERLVRAVACCLSVSRFEDASADVLASCYWSVPERRKTRVDGAAAARLLSRSLV
ncbi:unnamed protein product [Closterium sp. NIES-65]|nr:unnamed protein product [Closterium sp. NIES-65]CAI6010141.1 unnamed protein product [Closterium sp. NIES-65]